MVDLLEFTYFIPLSMERTELLETTSASIKVNVHMYSRNSTCRIGKDIIKTLVSLVYMQIYTHRPTYKIILRRTASSTKLESETRVVAMWQNDSRPTC